MKHLQRFLNKIKFLSFDLFNYLNSYNVPSKKEIVWALCNYKHTNRIKDVMVLFSLKNLSLKEIANHMNVTRERVRQMIKKGCRQARIRIEEETALFRILFGIKKKWQLSQTDLANILHRSPSTIVSWEKNKDVHVSFGYISLNDAHIYEFIKFYDSVSSLFIREKDQIKWLKTPSPDFDNKSPLELLKINSKNLYFLREQVDFLGGR